MNLPLKIETLFSDAAIEKDLLSGDELAGCLAEAGDEGSVHAVAIGLGLITANQVRRVYKKIYQSLDRRYRGCAPVAIDCAACEASISARFRLTYGIIPCPECLHPVNLAEADETDTEDPPSEEMIEVEKVEAVEVSEPPRTRVVERGMPSQLAGHKVIEKLGAGGMGTVYHCRTEDGQPVAIKVMPRDAQSDRETQRMMSECRLLQKLSHNKIRKLIKLKANAEEFHLIMEYIEGESLAELRARKGRLKPQSVLQIAYAVASALEHAHAHSILHRDVKPHNILLSTERRVKLTDFGLAISTDAITQWTMTGDMAGTPSYMSPEQCRGEKLDARSDLYSLGMTMYHCLAGRLPFEGDALSVVYRQVHGRVPSLYEHVQDLPDPVVQLVSRLLARDPADRYPDATSLKADLRYVISGKAPKIVPRTDHISLAQLDEARKIQQEIENTSGARVPMEEILARKGWIGRDADAESINADEPYRCRCGKTDLSTAMSSAFVCKKCNKSLRFDADVSLRILTDQVLVEILGAALATSEDRTDRIARHLKAACALGARQLVLDLSQLSDVDARQCGWMVDVAQRALSLRGTVSVLFPDSRSRDSFCSFGFDQFVRVYRSRAAFYDQETGQAAPEPAQEAAELVEEWAVTATLIDEPKPRRRSRGRRPKRRSAREQHQPRSGVFRAQQGLEDSEVVADQLQDTFYMAYEAGDYQAALDVLLAQDDSTVSLQGRYYRGICRWRVGLHDDAHDDLTWVLEQDEDNAEAWYVRGLVCQAIGDAEEAIEDYSRTIELSPKHVKAYCNRGAVRYSIAELDLSAEDFQSALEHNARHIRSLYGLGRIHADRNELMMAEVLLKQAVDYDPKFAPAYYLLARVSARSGELTDALQHLRQAVRLNPRLHRKSIDEEDFSPLRENPKLMAHFRSLKQDALNE